MQAQARANQESSAHEADLPTLALMAAIQLNRLIEHKPADPVVVDRFLTQLTEFSEIWNEHDPRHLAKNPTAFSLLSAAIRKIPGQPAGEALDLASRMMDLIQDYRDSSITGRPAGLKRMRAFCLALHDRMSADRVPVRDSETVF